MKVAVAVLGMVLVAIVVVPISRAEEARGKIEGRLVDDKRDPVEFANVIVSGPAIADTRGMMSTSEGGFVIANLQPGIYSVRLFHISYNKQLLKDIKVVAGETTHVTVELEDAVILLHVPTPQRHFVGRHKLCPVADDAHRVNVVLVVNIELSHLLVMNHLK